MVGITAVYCDVSGLVFGLLVCAFCLLGRLAAVGRSEPREYVASGLSGAAPGLSDQRDQGARA